MVYVIVKKYEHFNKSLPNWNSPKGKYIRTKYQYQEECKKAGLIPYEQAEQIYRDNLSKKTKRPKPSKETLDFLREVQSKSDKKGNVKLSGRAVDHMIKKGIVKDRDVFADKLPKHYQPKGGFSDATD